MGKENANLRPNRKLKITDYPQYLALAQVVTYLPSLLYNFSFFFCFWEFAVMFAASLESYEVSHLFNILIVI